MLWWVGIALINIFVNNLDEEMAGILIIFADGTKLVGTDYTLENRNNSKITLVGWKARQKLTKMNSSKITAKISTEEEKNEMTRYGMEDTWVGIQ